MPARIIDGKAVAASVLHDVAGRVHTLQTAGITPGLAAVLANDDPGSAAYVAGKERDAQSVGMASFIHRLPQSAGTDELMDLVRSLNDDPAVHGVIVQMPLWPHLDAVAAQEALDPRKDVDGLH